MNSLQTRIAKVGMTVLGAATYAHSAFADSAIKQGVDAARPGSTNEKGEFQASTPNSLNDFWKTAADVLIYLTGALAVLAIVYGGLRYVTSTGDAGRVKQAKDTILYGVVGVVVAILAFAIVNFIIKNI